MANWKRRARKWRKLYRAQTYLLGVEQEYSADGRATLHKALARARKWQKIARAWTEEHWKTHLRYLELCNERDALLAWQRGVREAYKSDGWTTDTMAKLEELRRAIEGDPVEPAKGDESC